MTANKTEDKGVDIATEGALPQMGEVRLVENQRTQVQVYQDMVEKALMNEYVTGDKLTLIMDKLATAERQEQLKQYATAMAISQSEIPAIKKSLQNKQTKSFYTDLKEIIAIAKPIYTSHGLSVSFGEEDSPLEGHIRIIGTVCHSGGYCKEFHLDQPIDNAGIAGTVNKTPTHAKGSSISYGRRYLHGMIFNLAFGEDDDGNGAGAPINFITAEQAESLRARLKALKGNLTAFLKNFGADKLEEIRESDLGKAERLLHDKEEAVKKKEEKKTEPEAKPAEPKDAKK